MKILQEYKTTLKNPKVEEFLDVTLYRPLAFILVKFFYKTSLTPNHISFMSFLSGLASAYFYSLGSRQGFLIGALFFTLFSVLDCCDGMLARLKGNGTPFGRIIDGLVDYSVNIVLYLGLGLGLAKENGLNLSVSPWVFAVAAGISKGLHSMTFDYYLHEYLGHSSKNFSSVDSESQKWRDEYEILNKQNGKFWQKFLLRSYLFFSQMQKWNKGPRIKYHSESYCKRNVLVLQSWGFIGPSMHGTVMIIMSFLYQPMLLFYFSAVFANIWMVFTWILQIYINSNTNQVATH